LTFNPPVLTLVGATLREETVHKLEQRLPTVTSTAASTRKDPPKFMFIKEPAHWRIEVTQQFCDHLARSRIYHELIETLEGEDWKLRATNCITVPDSGKDVSKFFFTRN